MLSTIVLSPEQVFAVGLIAVVIVQLVTLFVAKRWGQKTGKSAATFIAFVISIALAYVWIGIPLVAVSKDPMEFLGKLIEQAVPVFAFATLIYNTLIAKVFDKAGWTQEDFLNKVLPGPVVTEKIVEKPTRP